jgi:hypothetical protein
VPSTGRLRDDGILAGQAERADAGQCLRDALLHEARVRLAAEADAARDGGEAIALTSPAAHARLRHQCPRCPTADPGALARLALALLRVAMGQVQYLHCSD